MSLEVYYMDVFNTLDQLRAKEASLRNDANLSQAGKDKAIAGVRQERGAHSGPSLSKLQKAWSAARAQYTEMKAEREAVAEKAAKTWDYQRLNYNSSTARAVIQSARSPQDLSVAYETAKLSGDRHALRAFAETGVSLLGSQKTFVDTAAMYALKETMQKDVAQLLDTPELQAHREKETKLTDEIVKLANATSRAANEFYSSGGLFDQSNPFQELMKGVRISERVDNNLALIREVDLDWD